MSSIEVVKLEKIVKLAHSHQWVQWLKDINGWIIDKDYDLPAPEPVPAPVGVQTQAMIIAHQALISAHTIENNVWKRTQFKAVTGIRTACDTMADRLVASTIYNHNVEAVFEALAVEFKPNDQTTFTDANESLQNMMLSEFDNITKYIEAFSADIAALELVGKPMESPFSIPLFCKGLGEEFSGWHTAFNQLHSLFGNDPATLNQAFRSAKIESQRMGTISRGQSLLNARAALMAPVNTNRKRSFPNTSVPSKRRKCSTCAGIPGGDKFHTEDRCWIKNPVLRVEWEAKNPEKARLRRERLKAEGKPDPTARIAAIDEPTPRRFRRAEGAGHEFRE